MPAIASTTTFLGLPIGGIPLPSLVNEAIDSIASGDKRIVFACANPHSLAVAQHDYDFRQALGHADHLVADGVGLVLVARALKNPVEPRITGTEYFEAIMDKLAKSQRQLGRRGRVFFFGSSQTVLDKIKEKFAERYPELDLCGAISPPYGEWSDAINQVMIASINAAKPDVLWVGMTAPKQEKWVERNRAQINATVIGSIGAVFDFFAETYPRAPDWACRLGIEWIVRLVREPKRMWKRTFISAPRFISAAFRHHLTANRSNNF